MMDCTFMEYVDRNEEKSRFKETYYFAQSIS